MFCEMHHTILGCDEGHDLFPTNIGAVSLPCTFVNPCVYLAASSCRSTCGHDYLAVQEIEVVFPAQKRGLTLQSV